MIPLVWPFSKVLLPILLHHQKHGFGVCPKSVLRKAIDHLTNNMVMKEGVMTRPLTKYLAFDH